MITTIYDAFIPRGTTLDWNALSDEDKAYVRKCAVAKRIYVERFIDFETKHRYYLPKVAGKTGMVGKSSSPGYPMADIAREAGREIREIARRTVEGEG